MKRLFTNSIICSVIYFSGSCKNINKESAEKIQYVKSDTFYTKDYSAEHNNISIPQGVTFDSITEFLIPKTIKQYLIIPRLNNKSDSAIQINLNQGIIQMKNTFLKDENNLWLGENSNEITEGTVHYAPTNIYRSNILISYCFQICYSDNVLMRPFCSYESINYSIKSGEFISFSDYFEITTSEDSVYFKKLILSAVNDNEALGILTLSNKIDFSFDEQYVFFYFDQYELNAPFIIEGGIKKKYLEKYIRKEYK